MTVLLEDQDARPFEIIGIVFDNRSGPDRDQGVSCGESIRCKFIVAVIRYFDIPPVNQPEDLLKSFAHHAPVSDRNRGFAGPDRSFFRYRRT